MNYNRAFLQDIWDNKPYGYFTDLMKANKKNPLHNFMVTTKVYKETHMDTLTSVVVSSKASDKTIEDEKRKQMGQLSERYKGNDIKFKTSVDCVK